MSNSFLRILLLLTTSVVVASCVERASCWNDHRAQFTSCEDMRADEINKRLDQRERERERSK